MEQTKKTLIAFATGWGPQFGGINSFNQDLLMAVAIAFHKEINTICIVPYATEEQIQQAANSQVNCISLNVQSSRGFPTDLLDRVEEVLGTQKVPFSAEYTVWLGHDRITGEIALEATKRLGGRSAVVHHMSYDHYESFCESGTVAQQKYKEQKAIFVQADIPIAVGPLLSSALAEMLQKEPIPMLVPGLPDISVHSIFKRFKGFISGRLGNDAKKLKQGYLSISAFATAIRKADADPALPDCLRGSSEPALTLRGVEFEHDQDTCSENEESLLKQYAEQCAGRAFSLNALPFTTSREDLFADLQSASLAMMPSWHEGFGLVGWEAIAAGVPLVVSQKSGLYRLLQEHENGIYANLVYPIDVFGSNSEPYFADRDLDALTQKILLIAKDTKNAKQKAQKLREYLLQNYTWTSCAQTLVTVLGWGLSTSLPFEHTEFKPSKVTPEPLPATQISHSLLEMPTATWRLDSGLSYSRLLQAEEAVIPFATEREPFLNAQLDWATDNSYPISVRLLTGVGGAGKTRLALEMCHRLQKQGWQTGFLTSDKVQFENTLQSLRLANQPTLIVIDYSETRQQELLRLVKSLLASPQHSQQMKVLLLARDGGEWWDLLPSQEAACEALLDGMATTGPYILPKLHDNPSSRLAAYQAAMKAFADRLQIPEQPCIPGLVDEQFAHPLFVQMAALLALQGAQPRSAEAVSRALIGHERRYWRKFLSDIPLVAAQHEESASLLMALATLTNGLPTLREAELAWQGVGGEKQQLKAIFIKMVHLYPAKQGLLGLRPDLLGEALVAQVMLSADGENLLDSVLGSKQSIVRRSALTVLARMLQHRPALTTLVEQALTKHFVGCAEDCIAVMRETSGYFSKCVELAFTQLEIQHKNQVCGILEKYFSEYSLTFVDLAVLVFRAKLATIVQKTRKLENQKARKPTERDLADHSVVLSKLSFWLTWQGQVDEAAKTGKQALQILEKLARVESERYEPYWANSLGNYANRLGALGKVDEAAQTAKQALEIIEKLARVQPERYEPELATSLSNYANRLGELGKVDEAAQTAEQALEINEKLARAKPEKYEPDWASSLGNYANHLAELGKIDEAAQMAKQALELSEKLARAKPERYEPDWATFLGNYANRLGDLGKIEEAEQVSKRSLKIFEKLARAKPERYEPDWATSLSNYASHLSELGKIDEAAQAAKQALEIHERLARAKPERYDPDWANSLSNYANYLSELGKIDEAAQTAKQALEIRGKLARAKPERYEPDWAASLSNYANRLRELGKVEDAEQIAKQALGIREKLARAKPERYEPDWAISLSNYAGCLSELGRIDEAEKMAKQALEIRKKLVRAKPERYESDWATSLSNYAAHLCALGKVDEAVQSAKQALDIREKLARAKPERYEPDWAISLSNYAAHLSELGRIDEAAQTGRLALEIFEKLARAKPERYEFDYSLSKIHAAFYLWLFEGGQLNKIELQLKYSTQRQSRMLSFMENAVAALSVSDINHILDCLIQADEAWPDMDVAQRNSLEGFRLLLAGLAENMQIANSLTEQWREACNYYRLKRQNRLPRWVQQLACKYNIVPLITNT